MSYSTEQDNEGSLSSGVPQNSQEEEMKEEASSSSDSCDEEEAESAEISTLRSRLETSPYHYETHLELIKTLRDLGDLDKTRQAREVMSKLFPLTSELWLEWINDEMPLSCITEQKMYIRQLFEKAVKDYQSVKLWTEYCQYIMDNMDGEAGINDARAVFEKAITAVGLHVTEGVSIWDGYREFEMALYDSYQEMANGIESDEVQGKLQQQKEKVKAIFKREVSVSLIGMQGVYREFEEWLEDEDVPQPVAQAFKKAESKLEDCLPYEESLTSAADTKLEEYRSYIAYEVKGDDPARVQCLYERAIVDNCLNSEFWCEYTNYMDTKLNIPDIILPVHERAVRNCPWVVALWNNYLKAMERTGQTYEKTKELFERALSSGFSSAQNYVSLWCGFLEYLRRRVEDWSQDSKEKEDLREGFKKAEEYLEQYFGQNVDAQAQISRYRAHIEATKMHNLSEAKKIWDSVMTTHNREVEYWLEYIHLLRRANDTTGCRKLFQKAIQINSDNPELLCEAFQRFEREEGSLADLDNAVAKCSLQLKRVWERKTKEYEKIEARQRAEEEAAAKRSQQKAEKRAQKKAEMKSKLETTKRKHHDSDETARDKERSEPEPKRQHVSREDSSTSANEREGKETTKVPENVHKRSKDSQTVFVSNLLYTVDEEQLKSTFSPLGEIAEVRLVKYRTGKSKGYAYVEFKNESSVAAALTLDRQELCGRPMFVSPCVDKNQHPTTFRFPTSLDKCTVFVTNLPFEMKSTEIEDVFKVHGKLKQVRLVTNRSGKSKGFAYVEYEEEGGASAAVLKLDQTIVGERQISVALSNPPKKQRKENEAETNRQEGSRPGRARTQLQLLPRALQKSFAGDKFQSSNEEKAPSKPRLSNEDFRKMFQ